MSQESVTVLFLNAIRATRTTFLPICKDLHRRHCGSIDFVLVGPGGDIEADLSTPSARVSAMRRVVDFIQDDTFVLSSDRIFPIQPFDPFTPVARMKSGWLKRKGIETDAMVNTISALSEDGIRVLDHEIEVPQAYDRMKLSALLASIPDNTHFRTAYFSSYHHHPKRMEDPLIPLWKYGMVPEGPVISLEDTCFKHPDAARFLFGQI